MPKIHLCLLWHMHQPLYKNLETGEYRLPWARLHALKDYYGMVRILNDFPAIHQTFNLVPSLVSQIEDYAKGQANDLFLQLAAKPAETLSPGEIEFILNNFFQANEVHAIRRYGRYAELLDVMRRNEFNAQRAAELFDIPMLRDLQVLSQLVWFDELHLASDGVLRELARRGSAYTLEDQALIISKQQGAIAQVLDVYREFTRRGQIELSTSPFYHPILPLLCDTNIAQVSHPYVALPQRFCHPEDARAQMERARDYMRSRFGFAPVGMWPSEGAISNAVLGLAAHSHYRWIASGEGVLAQTLGGSYAPGDVYQPYTSRQQEGEIQVIFRDRRLSDLIGFVYSRMPPADAAEHFLNEVRNACRQRMLHGHDSLVAIILDGENAWETYPENGRPFLRELYARITQDTQIDAVTVTEAIQRVPARDLPNVYPGSWLDANLDLWIGSEDDNRAWDFLAAARNAYEAKKDTVSEEARQNAYEELLIAEGSDWFWWYGPEHFSVNKPEFDSLFRGHLSRVYRHLAEEPPPELSQAILHRLDSALHDLPSALIQPAISGTPATPNEWAYAGRYRVDPRSGAMHARRSFAQAVYYGTDGKDLFLRADLAQAMPASATIDFRFALKNAAGAPFYIQVTRNPNDGSSTLTNLPTGAVMAAVGTVCEARVSLSALQSRLGEPLFLQVVVLRDRLPVASIPLDGEVEIGTVIAVGQVF